MPVLLDELKSFPWCGSTEMPGGERKLTKNAKRGPVEAQEIEAEGNQPQNVLWGNKSALCQKAQAKGKGKVNNLLGGNKGRKGESESGQGEGKGRGGRVCREGGDGKS